MKTLLKMKKKLPLPIVTNTTLRKDECKCRKFGKKEPANIEHLNTIASEEIKNAKKIFRRLLLREPGSQQNGQNKDTGKIAEQRGIKNRAIYMLFFAFILILVDLVVIVVILQKIYHNLLEVIPIGILLNIILVFAISLILEKKAEEKEKLKNYILYSGFFSLYLVCLG